MKNETTNFDGLRFGNKVVEFEDPKQLPKNDEQRRQWQAANKAWWEASPMRYDWREELAPTLGDKSYFEEVDRRFLSSARKYTPPQKLPFDRIIPFAKIAGKDVLEIGVGQGTHAQLIAPRCRSYTGIDLTGHAVAMTSKRLALFGIPGRVLQMDAEEMKFPDNSFDYIWSWGVIHHSADTRRVLTEMRRVLRTGGSATVMVYYRSWWCFYICGLLRRIFLRQFRHGQSLHSIAQGATDGAIARYYLRGEWHDIVDGLFRVKSTRIFGLKTEVFPFPHGRLKSLLESLVPDAVTRFMTNQLRMGTFLVADMEPV